MAISFSRPDPSSPSAVSAATFAVARRGFDQAEVRDLLRMVAAELARLQERERFLERELKNAQRAAPTAAVALDEDVVTRLLGEEAARVLTSARDAANSIKVRAEENAARLLREATEESQKLREEAEVEAARRKHDAAADAEAELEMAKQQGREMVTEARSYRERVLAELSRRREAAREQIEALIDGRDRLLQAFERARSSAVDVIANLAPLSGPSEFVNLAPTTGPVPVMVPGSSEPRHAAAEEQPDEHEPAAAEQPEPATEAVVVVAVDAVVEAEPEPEPEVLPPPSLEELAADLGDETTVLAVPEGPADEAEAPSNVVSLFAGEIDQTAPPAHAASDAESVFARLRASRENADTAPTPLAVQPSPAEPSVEQETDDSAFGRRDSALTPIIVAAARKLKRALADEQNEVLHVLRGKEPVRRVEMVVPGLADQADRYCAAIAAELNTAALAGAASVDDGGDDAHTADLARTDALRPARDTLTETIVAPLRERLERAVADADGDNGELVGLVRSIYREWKTQRIDEHLDDIARMAFGRGALAALVPGTPIRWIVDPHGPACPDAEDNALGGVVAAGEPFPTDHVCAPAHPGCRCMIALDRQ